MKHFVMVLLWVCLFNGLPGCAQTAPMAADAVMQGAFSQAAKENKKVFLMFHASWCGWCHKMDAAMRDKVIRKFFDDNYVITHLTVLESGSKRHLENPGANEMLERHAGNNSGIPFWMVFDKDGNVLADALMRPEGAGTEVKGENCGCPASVKEVAHFINVLKNTSPLQPTQLALIEKRFRENER